MHDEATPADETGRIWPSEADRKATQARAAALTPSARRGGMRFEGYLPPDLACWILGKVEAGIFLDPSEAVFVLMGEMRDLEPHKDLRAMLLQRSLAASLDDPRPSLPAEDVLELLRRRSDGPRPAPAHWPRSSTAEDIP